jgi:hypothetical protein
VVDPEQALHRLTGDHCSPLHLVAAAAVVAATAARGTDSPGAPTGDVLDALVMLHWMQAELSAVEPALIAAARTAGASWQDLAPALGVASRQAAERRYLRLTPASSDQPATR